ncbi:hypothetical protein C8R43DRAFT_878099, partial [Mycena crocata]
MVKLSVVIAIARLRGDAVCVIGDLNGRTGQLRATKVLHPERFSMDTTVNTQGRAILQMGDDHGLRILNGDPKFGNGSWGWTYTQIRAGKPCQSVIDYALCDLAACSMVEDFEVLALDSNWSDHAALVLKMKVPHT